MGLRRITKEGQVYFVTLTVASWVDVFTRKEYVSEIVESLKFCREKKGLKIYSYVIMTNHIHMISESEDGVKLNEILGGFKSFTAHQILAAIKSNAKESRKDWMLHEFASRARANPASQKFQFWEEGTHPIQIWNDEVLQQKINYIHNNPVKSGIVASANEYLNSSAHPNGPIKIDDVKALAERLTAGAYKYTHTRPAGSVPGQ